MTFPARLAADSSFLALQPRPRGAEAGPHLAERVLARLLEGGTEPGPLSRALNESGVGLEAALRSQPVAFRRGLEHGLGVSGLGEALSLAAERDPQLFGEGLLALGRKLETAGRLPQALHIYAALQSFSENAAAESAALSGSASRAAERVRAIRGEGAVGARFEFLSRHFVEQATDPAMLLGMTGAGLVFRGVRLFALSRLLGASNASLLTRGFAPRLFASSAGLLAESFAFTGGVRLGNGLLGRSQDWSLSALRQEWAAGAITLMSLRATGALAHGAVANLGRGGGIAAGVTRHLLPQASMFGGILLSHRLEERLGLRAARQNGTEFTDALATLLQFQVAGRLARVATGESWRAMEHSLDRQAERLGNAAPLLGSPRFSDRGGFPPFGAAPAMAGIGRLAPSRRRSLEEIMREPLQMSADPKDKRGPSDRPFGPPPRESGISSKPPPPESGSFSQENYLALWRTIGMTSDHAVRRGLVDALFIEARSQTRALSFLFSLLHRKGEFQGRDELLAELQQGLQNLEVGALTERAGHDLESLGWVNRLGRFGNRGALEAIGRMDFSGYRERANADIHELMALAPVLRFGFDLGNGSVRELIQGLDAARVDGLSRETELRIQSGNFPGAAEAVELLAIVGRSRGDRSLQALELLRSFPVELYENAEIQPYTVEALYMMAQAGNRTAAEVLGSIGLYELRPGSASLLMILHRYGSEHSIVDLRDLAEEGDLGAVSVLRDLVQEGSREAMAGLRDLNPREIIRQVDSNDRALFALGVLVNQGNPAALRMLQSRPSWVPRLRNILMLDPLQLVTAVTPEMRIENACGEITAFRDLPGEVREEISRDIFRRWMESGDKARHYAENRDGEIGIDLIPQSFIASEVQAGIARFNARRASLEFSSVPPPTPSSRPPRRPRGDEN